MSFRHDSTGIDPDEQFPLLPDGWYPFKIFEAEELKSSKGNDMVLVKAMVVNDPRYPDMTVWHYVTFLPKTNPDGSPNKGAGISVHFRRCIGVPFGGDDVVDADDWVGRRFMGKVITEEYKGKRNNKFAEISPMRDEGDGEPVTAGKKKVNKEDDIPF